MQGSGLNYFSDYFTLDNGVIYIDDNIDVPENE